MRLVRSSSCRPAPGTISTLGPATGEAPRPPWHGVCLELLAQNIVPWPFSHYWLPWHCGQPKASVGHNRGTYTPQSRSVASHSGNPSRPLDDSVDVLSNNQVENPRSIVCLIGSKYGAIINSHIDVPFLGSKQITRFLYQPDRLIIGFHYT